MITVEKRPVVDQRRPAIIPFTVDVPPAENLKDVVVGISTGDVDHDVEPIGVPIELVA